MADYKDIQKRFGAICSVTSDCRMGVEIFSRLMLHKLIRRGNIPNSCLNLTFAHEERITLWSNCYTDTDGERRLKDNKYSEYDILNSDMPFEEAIRFDSESGEWQLGMYLVVCLTNELTWPYECLRINFTMQCLCDNSLSVCLMGTDLKVVICYKHIKWSCEDRSFKILDIPLDVEAEINGFVDRILESIFAHYGNKISKATSLETGCGLFDAEIMAKSCPFGMQPFDFYQDCYVNNRYVSKLSGSVSESFHERQLKVQADSMPSHETSEQVIVEPAAIQTSHCSPPPLPVVSRETPIPLDAPAEAAPAAEETLKGGLWINEDNIVIKIPASNDPDAHTKQLSRYLTAILPNYPDLTKWVKKRWAEKEEKNEDEATVWREVSAYLIFKGWTLIYCGQIYTTSLDNLKGRMKVLRKDTAWLKWKDDQIVVVFNPNEPDQEPIECCWKDITHADIPPSTGAI